MNASGFLEVGTNGRGEVVINHPDLRPDAEGFGHIVFSVEEARNLANLLLSKSADAVVERGDIKTTFTNHSRRMWSEPETPEHREIDPSTGMQKDYVVLCPNERAKGFVKPVRRSYRHKTCGSVTTIGLALSETYARDPYFYSGTTCVNCHAHFPLDQFNWEDGEPMDPALQETA